jgi:hypothetical protein
MLQLDKLYQKKLGKRSRKMLELVKLSETVEISQAVGKILELDRCLQNFQFGHQICFKNQIIDRKMLKLGQGSQIPLNYIFRD